MHVWKMSLRCLLDVRVVWVHSTRFYVECDVETYAYQFQTIHRYRYDHVHWKWRFESMFQQIHADKQQVYAIIQAIEIIVVLDVLRCKHLVRLGQSLSYAIFGSMMLRTCNIRNVRFSDRLYSWSGFGVSTSLRRSQIYMCKVGPALFKFFIFLNCAVLCYVCVNLCRKPLRDKPFFKNN